MSDEVLQQDLSEVQHPGAVFMMQLLFKEPCAMPEKQRTLEVMTKHLTDVECFCHDDKVAGYAARKYTAHFKDASMPPQLMITSCNAFDADRLGALERSQMWDCPESERILSECKYQVVATDMMAAPLSARDRAEMVMDFAEALVELYPQCEAVLFSYSGKLFTADKIRNHSIPREDRFVYFAVNVRFFRIEGTEDMMVDTLGMGTLYYPDLQYHFRGLDPNVLVTHAYNVAGFILANDNPIKDGDTIAGCTDDGIDEALQWVCRYEQSLIQPAREVVDINTGEFAAGNREDKQ